MSSRPIDLLDLPVVYRYRHSVLPLDSRVTLTRGNPLSPTGVLAYLDLSRHVYTAVTSNNDDAPLIGSISHASNETFARLTFLAPQDKLSTAGLLPLLEHLSIQAGKWGVSHILAEVDEVSAAFQPLRRAGFAVYAWQRIWNLSDFSKQTNQSSLWKKPDRLDLPALQGLYRHIIPASIQPVESYPQQARGLICCSGEKLNAYAWINSGPLGYLARPLIHPDAAQVAEKLTALVNSLTSSAAKPVYLCVRSYQAWLEPVLEEMGASVGTRQAVMVKHLMQAIPDEQVIRTAPSVGVSIQPSQVSQIERK